MSPHPAHSPGEVPAGSDPDAYDRLRRRVLWAMPTGLFVIGSRADAAMPPPPDVPPPADPPPAAGPPATGPPVANLMTANLVVQVATEPKLVAVAIETGSVTAGLVEASGWFTVSILERAERALVRKFVKPVGSLSTDESGELATMSGVAVGVAPSSTPVLRQALGWLDCEVRHHLPLGSHRLFVGEVMAVGARQDGLAASPEVLRMEDTRMNYGG